MIQQEKEEGVIACINSKCPAELRKVNGNRFQMATKKNQNAVDCPSETVGGKNNTISTTLQEISNSSHIKNGQSLFLTWSLPFGSS